MIIFKNIFINIYIDFFSTSDDKKKRTIFRFENILNNKSSIWWYVLKNVQFS